MLSLDGLESQINSANSSLVVQLKISEASEKTFIYLLNHTSDSSNKVVIWSFIYLPVIRYHVFQSKFNVLYNGIYEIF